MPVVAPAVKQEGPGQSNVSGGEPKGQRTRFFFETHGKGVPRPGELVTVRILEDTHTVSLPMDTIKTQVKTTPFTVRPTVEEPSTEHFEVADDILEFLDGGFNVNGESFDSLANKWAHDVLSINSGIVEKVPTEEGWLAELYSRDGATFVKAPDEHNRFPLPGEEKPAYWQFSLHNNGLALSGHGTLEDLIENPTGYHTGVTARKPIPFSRDEIVWTEEDPRPNTVYGPGRVQKVRRLVEIILNQDVTNRRYFDRNEIPHGVVNFVDHNQDEIDRTREWWKDNVKGQEHVLPFLGGNGSDVEFIQFQPTQEQMQFLQSQEWYNKLVWMIFGLNQNEVGDISEVTRPGGTKQFAAKVFHRTTKPLLELLAAQLNNQILPFHERYWDVDGEIEFAWNFDNPEIQALERERQMEDLTNGIATVNEVRVQRGQEEVPWGDMPNAAVTALARQHPEWVAQEWGGIEDPPEPAAPSPGLLGAEPEETTSTSTSGSRRRWSSPLAIAKDDDEALRNEQSNEFPPLKEHVDELARQIGIKFEEAGDDLEELVQEAFPEEPPETDAAPDAERKATLPDLDSIVDGIALAEPLRQIVVEANEAAMEAAAEHHAEDVQSQLEDFADDGDEAVDITIDFDLEDTFALEHMKRKAAQNMVSVESEVKERVRSILQDVAEDGGGVDDATAALRDQVDELSTNHSRTVARTESLSSARHGSQALAESTDAIGGKEWMSTDDGRTRPWHAAMDGEIVPKEEDFIVPSGWQGEPHYQPADYPRSAFVVGDDQPFNCRCAQRPVLEEDLPEDVQGLSSVRGITVKDPLTDRQREVYTEHAQPGEDFDELLERVIDESSRNQAYQELGISKSTLYQWLDE